MPDPVVFIASAVVAFAFLTTIWLLSLARRDASIVDIAWGLGFVLIAAVCFTRGAGAPLRRALVLTLTCAWGLRLAAYLSWRNLGRGEDFRYRKMRSFWGPRFAWVSLFTVFWLQASLMWVVSLPIQFAAGAPGPASLTSWDLAGLVLTLAGIACESIADLQLARFRADPHHHDRVLDQGLWAWTRHPNYFGDFLVWWGLGLIALATPWGHLALLGPLVMSFLLLRVSGVPMLERSLRRNRPGYADYVERVPAFLPRPPRRR